MVFCKMKAGDWNIDSENPACNFAGSFFCPEKSHYCFSAFFDQKNRQDFPATMLFLAFFETPKKPRNRC